MSNLIKELVAPEGKFLTQNKGIDINERLFVKRISGASVTSSDWREATSAELSAYDEYSESLEIINEK